MVDESETAFDAFADPGGALRALDGEGSVVLRASRPLGEGASAHGPDPSEPVWMTVGSGGGVSIADLRETTRRQIALALRRAWSAQATSPVWAPLDEAFPRC